jgi:hypothetical protein
LNVTATTATTASTVSYCLNPYTDFCFSLRAYWKMVTVVAVVAVNVCSSISRAGRAKRLVSLRRRTSNENHS